MAELNKSSALIKHGPMGAPILGAVLMVIFIVAVFLVGDTDKPARTIADTVAQVNSKLNDPKVTGNVKFNAHGIDGAAAGLGPAGKLPVPGPVASERKALDLPLQFRVVLGATEGLDFADADENRDGKLSRDEFDKTRKARQGRTFDELDKRAPIGSLDEDEYSEREVDPRRKQFDDLDRPARLRHQHQQRARVEQSVLIVQQVAGLDAVGDHTETDQHLLRGMRREERRAHPTQNHAPDGAAAQLIGKVTHAAHLRRQRVACGTQRRWLFADLA